jgi:hypothetical protein
VALRFILRSPNKAGGTGNLPEHQAIPFVDGVGNAETREETSMSNRFLISVAAAALIAGTGFANAQGTGMGRDAGSAGSAAQQSAPSSERGGGASSGTMQRDSGGASDMKATQSEPKAKGAEKNQRADDQMKGGKDMKAEGKEDRGGMKAEQKSEKGQTTGQGTTQRDQSTTQRDQTQRDQMQRDQTTTQGRDQPSRDQKAQGQDRTQQDRMQTQTQGGAAGQSTTTTGQAGAAGKLSTEQRTQITSVIKEQRVQPVTNVNFSISVGTRVPRDVTFHTLPERVVTIYPEWRSYKYILVKEQIVIVDPNTYEIVAVLEV